MKNVAIILKSTVSWTSNAENLGLPRFVGSLLGV